jgi:hypothetical protein
MSITDNIKEGGLIPELARGLADDIERGVHPEWDETPKLKLRVLEALRQISRKGNLQ